MSHSSLDTFAQVFTSDMCAGMTDAYATTCELALGVQPALPNMFS